MLRQIPGAAVAPVEVVDDDEDCGNSQHARHKSCHHVATIPLGCASLCPLRIKLVGFGRKGAPLLSRRKVARYLGVSAIWTNSAKWRKNTVVSWTSRKLLHSDHSLLQCVSVSEIECANLGSQPLQAKSASVLGMAAKGMDACDNVSCSTSLRGMLHKEATML